MKESSLHHASPVCVYHSTFQIKNVCIFLSLSFFKMQIPGLAFEGLNGIRV